MFRPGGRSIIEGPLVEGGYKEESLGTSHATSSWTAPQRVVYLKKPGLPARPPAGDTRDVSRSPYGKGCGEQRLIQHALRELPHAGLRPAPPLVAALRAVRRAGKERVAMSHARED